LAAILFTIPQNLVVERRLWPADTWHSATRPAATDRSEKGCRIAGIHDARKSATGAFYYEISDWLLTH
jgi:hypothetical protein